MDTTATLRETRMFGPLYKRSGKGGYERCFGRVFLLFLIAEDPKSRMWSTQSEDNKRRTTYLFSLAKLERYDADDVKTSGLNLIIGPFSLYCALLPKSES